MAVSIAADEALFIRAENEVPTVPTVIGLAGHLQIINAPTLASDEEKYEAVRDWCVLIEACQTLEEPEARRLRMSDAAIAKLIAKVPAPEVVAVRKRKRVP